MVILKMSDAQAKALTAVLHSGMSAGAIKDLGLTKVHRGLVDTVGARKFSPIAYSILMLDPAVPTEIVRVDEEKNGPDIIINCV